MQAVDVTDPLTWNTPSWSISAEFWTYILFALIVLLAPRYRTMAFAVAALAAQGPTVIRDADCAGVSYPTFFDDLERVAEP